jgi:hypothetical protein
MYLPLRSMPAIKILFFNRKNVIRYRVFREIASEKIAVTALVIYRNKDLAGKAFDNLKERFRLALLAVLPTKSGIGNAFEKDVEISSPL